MDLNDTILPMLDMRLLPRCLVAVSIQGRFATLALLASIAKAYALVVFIRTALTTHAFIRHF